jgi:hypothetical protein
MLGGLYPEPLMRPSLLVLIAAAGLVAAGCGSPDTRTSAETEGLYVDVGPLTYQVQISRYLNPYDTEDKAYLSGLPSGTQADQKGYVWFGIFVRIKNYSDQTQVPAEASGYKITDTEGNTFHPVQLDRKLNWYAYTPAKILPAAWFPSQDTTAGMNPIDGELLVFRLPVSAIQNRPLDLHIENGGHSATVSLDL